ncbi:hypothetical protein Poly41_50260 [Novipirellula artificiosorum]|uniref:Uncharacterized protein n=1 Tax=Novipirellula artificiosorum TaxID=2528016 RepID=A0A5C6DBQ0_9BACT|nr:hypothetical protein Poly41_50260 [Novipirellula artificiosorum]
MKLDGAIRIAEADPSSDRTHRVDSVVCGHRLRTVLHALGDESVSSTGQ